MGEKRRAGEPAPAQSSGVVPSSIATAGACRGATAAGRAPGACPRPWDVSRQRAGDMYVYTPVGRIHLDLEERRKGAANSRHSENYSFPCACARGALRGSGVGKSCCPLPHTL